MYGLKNGVHTHGLKNGVHTHGLKNGVYTHEQIILQYLKVEKFHM